MSNSVRYCKPEAWDKAMSIARPIAHACGYVANIQLDKELHFLAEQSYPSKLFEVNPWPKVLQHPDVSQTVYDRCKFGQRVRDNSQYNGLFLKKSSSLTTSAPELTHYFQNKKCQGETDTHQHLMLEGHSKQLGKQLRLHRL